MPKSLPKTLSKVVSCKSPKTASSSSTKGVTPKAAVAATKAAGPKGEATYSASIDYRKDPSTYRVGRGERGVLTCQPYKDEILPLWKFATPPQAQASAEAIYAKFKTYQDAGDFVGQDLARKFLQMGYTRAMRYHNNAGGKKPDGTTEGRTDYAQGGFVPTGEASKKDSAEAFKVFWRRVVDEDEVYKRMKKEWMKGEGQRAKEAVEEAEEAS